MNSQAPLISIVLLCYNQESIVYKSIESILNQDYENLEIIISDDCSTDNTFKIIRAAHQNYQGPHRLIINQNTHNLGVGNHCYHAVGLTAGEYIVLAAGDDISLPNRVRQAVAVVKREGELGAVIGRFHPFNDEPLDIGEWQPSHAVNGHNIRAGSDDWFKFFHKGKLVGTPGAAVAMWNRKLFFMFDPIPKGVLAEDILLVHRCLIAGLGISFTSNKILFYRQHSGNSYAGMSKSEFERKIFFTRALGLLELKTFRLRHPKLHEDQYWEKMTRVLEGGVFRSIVQMRQPYVGKIKSYILRLFGLRGAKLH